MRVNFKRVKAAASLCGPCGDLSLRDRVPVNTLQTSFSSVSVQKEPFKLALHCRHGRHGEALPLAQGLVLGSRKHRAWRALCCQSLSSPASTAGLQTEKYVTLCFALKPSTVLLEDGNSSGRSFLRCDSGAGAAYRPQFCYCTHISLWLLENPRRLAPLKMRE